MTDLMIDQLLAQTREPEPVDDAFVQIVMHDVRADAQRRWRMRLVRRPVVFGVAAAVLATSGAVAALVGTHAPHREALRETPGVARVAVEAPHVGSSQAPASVRPAVPGAGTAATQAPVVTSRDGLRWGFPTDHTAYIVDDRTGLRLTTETYTSRFIADRTQRVTLTIENTSSHPIVISAANGCALQVLASPAGGTASPARCASAGAADDKIVLAPGSMHSADAQITLARTGNWGLVGMCRCNYTQPSQAQPTRSNDLIGDLTQRAVPSPLVPTKTNPESGSTRLATPAIAVKVASP